MNDFLVKVETVGCSPMNENAKRKLVEMANAWRYDVVDTGQLSSIVTHHNVVVGIWHEANGDVGHLIVKGKPELQSIADHGGTAALSIAAVPFIDSEEAAAARHVFGDDRRIV